MKFKHLPDNIHFIHNINIPLSEYFKHYITKFHIFAPDLKFLAVILSLTVLFLAIKPGLDFIVVHVEDKVSCCGDTCDANSANAEFPDENKTDDCTGNSCNPFQSCGVNSVLPVIALSAVLHNQEIETESNFKYQFNIHSQLIADFWQPPRIV